MSSVLSPDSIFEMIAFWVAVIAAVYFFKKGKAALGWVSVACVVLLPLLVGLISVTTRAPQTTSSQKAQTSHQATLEASLQPPVPEAQTGALPSCSFEMTDVKEQVGNFGDNDYYHDVTGVIKNTSGRKEHLKDIFAKLYSKDGAEVGPGGDAKGGADFGEMDLNDGMSIPFRVNIRDSWSDSSKDIIEPSLRLDVYPWFTTCK